jgi:NTP pyrophosphatase (non-canonical NTP hydrolase)
MKTLVDLTNEIKEIFKQYEKQGTLPWDYKVATTDLSYQIGNLTKAILQLQNYRYREGMNDGEIKKKAADELADILAEVLIIADDLKIDLYEAWENMVKSDHKKISDRKKI